MNSNQKWPTQPTIDLPSIDTIDNPEQTRRYQVEFSCPEWTAICPKSGFPDFGTIHIIYQPNKKCIELKSLKLYLNAFRNQGIYHETAVNLILNDLLKACEPWHMEVVGDFNVRGNIKTIIKAIHPDPFSKTK